MLISILGLFGMPVCVLVLLIQLIRRKSKKKAAIAFATCFVMFIGGGIWAANKPESAEKPESMAKPTEIAQEITPAISEDTEKPIKTNYKKLDEYEWGSVLKEVFEKIGVEKVISVDLNADEYSGYIYDLYIETEVGRLSVELDRYNTRWEVRSVSNAGAHETLSTMADFYLADYLKYDDEGNQIRDIYSYKTGEILEAKNEEAIKAAEEEKRKQQEEYENVPGNSSKKPMVVTINEFVNEIVADIDAAKKKYNGKWIQITGTVKDISDAGDMIGYYIYGARGVPGLKITCWVYNDKLVANRDQEVTFKGIVREVSTINNTEIGECTLIQ